jgi:hypothetical protein
MFRTLLKLACVALIANATWHMFGALSPHYKFKDGVEYAVQNGVQAGGDNSDDAVVEKILALAVQFDVPVTAADVSIARSPDRRPIVDISYVRPVELAPGFKYPLPLSIHVDTFVKAKVPAR